MTVRAIVPIGHPVLREPTREVSLTELASDTIQTLIDDLIDTMRDAAGAGLAATQVGEGVRIAVMEVEQNRRYPYKPPIPLTVMVNPHVEPLDDERVEINEGCLSVPNLRGTLHRWVNVRLNYLNRLGEPQEQIVRGLSAGTVQHELDHLDGTLIVDRIDPRTMATWDMFETYQREAFVERITAFVQRVGS